MGARHPNPRLVKIHRTYSVEEIARLFSTHKNTVRNWLRQGLTAIDRQRPALVLGSELIRFLRERRQKAKQKCGPGRIYCIACRAPKVPAGNVVDCILATATAGNLCGICPDCERMIYRRLNLGKIEAIRGDLEITVRQPQARIRETAGPSVNCDSSGKT
jgi:hypothetical protein